MINENQLSEILSINKYYSFKTISNKLMGNKFITNKFMSTKTLFGSPLKKFINNVYNTFEIPQESFIISMYYIYNFYENNKNNSQRNDNGNNGKAEKADNVLKYFFNNINTFIFTSIVISLKNIYDESLDIRTMCYMQNIDFNSFLETERIILNGLNWNTSYQNDDYLQFKNLMVHYMD